MDERLATVRVVNIDRTAGKGGLLAMAIVDLGGIVVRGWRITKNYNGGARVSVPMRIWFDGGERYSEPLVDLPEQLRREVFEAIKGAYMAEETGSERAAT